VTLVNEGTLFHVVYRWTGAESPGNDDIETLKADPNFGTEEEIENWEWIKVKAEGLVYVTDTPPVAGDEFHFIVFQEIGNDWVSSGPQTFVVPGFGEGTATLGVNRIETGTDTGIYKAQVFGKWPGVPEGVVPGTVVPGSVVVQYRVNGDGKWIDDDVKPNGVMFEVSPTGEGDDTDATRYEFRLLYKTADGWFVVVK